MGSVAPVYRPRDAEHPLLQQVFALHLEAFLDAVAEADDGAGRAPGAAGVRVRQVMSR